MEIIEFRRNRKAEVSASYGVFRITAIDRVSSECWFVTQVLHSAATIRACAVCPANPRDANASAPR